MIKDKVEVRKSKIHGKGVFATEYFNIGEWHEKSDEEMINDSIDEIIRISEKLYKSPTVEEYNKLRIKGYPRRTLEKKTGA